MHSRISSTRPSLIFCGRKGSAIEGRADPIMSITPLSIAETIESLDDGPLADHVAWHRQLSALAASERSAGKTYAEATNWIGETPMPVRVRDREVVGLLRLAEGALALLRHRLGDAAQRLDIPLDARELRFPRRCLRVFQCRANSSRSRSRSRLGSQC